MQLGLSYYKIINRSLSHDVDFVIYTSSTTSTDHFN